MKIVVHKETKRVAMYSDGPINVDRKIFDIIDYEPTRPERASLEANDTVFFRNKKMEIYAGSQTLEEQRKVMRKELIDEVSQLESTGSPTTQDLLQCLKKLSNILEQDLT